MASSKPERARPVGEIVIVGARQHSLKDVSVRIPRRALTVITGVSGSGKSSLAFDTLYAEGQRRYVESMSTYARQFLERMPRPDVDSVSGVPPAIAIEQRNGVRNARSTVGTATEIADYLRLLYATIGEVHCPKCGRVLERDNASAAAARMVAAHPGVRVQVIADVEGGDGARLDELLKAGHRRVLLDGKAARIDELDARARVNLLDLPSLPLIIDRLVASEADRGRLAGALDTAFSLAGGRARVVVEGHDEPVRLDEGFRCKHDGTELPPPSPASFSYNSPLGACAACQGFGRLVGIDWDKVIPDAGLTLGEGCIAIFQTPANRECQSDLERACKRLRVRLDVPWRELGDSERRLVLDGEGGDAWRKGRWYGVNGFFGWLETKKYKMHVRVLLSRYRGYTACTECEGTRLRKEARSVFLEGKSIAELEALPVAALQQFLAALHLDKQAKLSVAAVLRELDARLGYLGEVGLGYLALIRQTRSLSGGEAQRIALASALGAQLTGTLYVLDEPSVGLHPRDADRLLRVLRRLVDRGNTVVLVEHDPDIIRAADHIIDLGPGAGEDGGRVVFEGSFDALTHGRHAGSRTADIYRHRARALPPSPLLLFRDERSLTIRGARCHNLKNLDVAIPLGRITCVTGVSGSGKSSLVENVLYGNFMRALGRPCDDVGECDALLGIEALDDVILVDQTPLARSSRSNPATYLKAFDEIRKLLAKTDEAKRLGLEAGAFSFNVPGGRCETCAGQGFVTLEMHFLADLTVPCEACDGRRFGESVLGVRFAGKNVTEILASTVDEALVLFGNYPKITNALRPFAEVGLGYLRLGQSTSTLSGGESQRLKLAAYLADTRGPSRKPLLFLLDEPTTGLHASDVELLLACLRRLRDAGHTIVVVEHNLDLIRQCDWLIDLGPEAGDAGGEIVAVGPPSEIARVRGSHTGHALAGIASARQA